MPPPPPLYVFSSLLSLLWVAYATFCDSVCIPKTHDFAIEHSAICQEEGKILQISFLTIVKKGWEKSADKNVSLFAKKALQRNRLYFLKFLCRYFFAMSETFFHTHQTHEVNICLLDKNVHKNMHKYKACLCNKAIIKVPILLLLKCTKAHHIYISIIFPALHFSTIWVSSDCKLFIMSCYWLG